MKKSLEYISKITETKELICFLNEIDMAGNADLIAFYTLSKLSI